MGDTSVVVVPAQAPATSVPEANVTTETPPVLEARGITKSFGRVIALRGADFSAREGEVSALVGDNGAGKSTLIKMFSGALQPDGGTILIDGKPISFHNPQDARPHGLATVYQDPALAPPLHGAS